MAALARITALEAENAALHAERNAAINQVMGFLHITHDSMISWADAADEIVSALAGLRAEIEALRAALAAHLAEMHPSTVIRDSGHAVRIDVWESREPSDLVARLDD